MPNNNIVFAGLSRLRDQLPLIAVYDRIPSDEKNEIQKVFVEALTDGAHRYSAGCRDKRPYSTGALYIYVDQQLCGVYVVATRTTKKAYPERVAFTFLQDFMDCVAKSEYGPHINTSLEKEQWTGHFRKPVKELMSTYDDPGNVDTTSSVHKKVEHVKGLMQDNISKVLATQADLTDLEAKTTTLQLNAEELEHGAKASKKKFWSENVKITVLLAVLGLCVLGYLGVMIFHIAKKGEAR